jgi:hypothetical protein
VRLGQTTLDAPVLALFLDLLNLES